MRRQFIYVTTPICIAIIVAGAWLADAGNLNPPPGPVNPTMVTLDDINATALSAGDKRTPIASLPFTINQCGSYFLTGCLTGAAGQNGITIAADDVTLDLNGFALIGVPGSLDGINMAGFQDNVVIRNGHVRAWGESGIDARIHVGRIERITATDNGAWGIENSFGGTFTSHIASCEALRNGVLVASSGGIQGAGSTLITDCIASENTGNGISVSTGSTVADCLAGSNTGGGIVGSLNCTVSSSSASTNNGIGIFINSGTIKSCVANANDMDGIVGSRCVISACTSDGNLGDGIEVASGSVVLNNSCDGNGPAGADGAGIHVTGSDNRIEGNNVTNNDRGIDFGFPTGGTNNIVIKNTARNNVDGVTLTNYKFPLGVLNTVGEILDFTGGGGVLTASNSSPWANFEY